MCKANPLGCYATTNSDSPISTTISTANDQSLLSVYREMHISLVKNDASLLQYVSLTEEWVRGEGVGWYRNLSSITRILTH
jgi:hypothetical protein